MIIKIIMIKLMKKINKLQFMNKNNKKQNKLIIWIRILLNY